MVGIKLSLGLVFVAALAPTSSAFADPGAVIASMDEPRFHPPKEKGSSEAVDGKFGKAVHFRFDQGAQSTFFTSNIHGTPDWDRADGFSFWVKGDGDDGFGGLQFIFDDDYAVRYDYCFPVKGQTWTKVTAAWADLIAVLPGPKALPLGRPGGNPPTRLSALWFGKWWYWQDYPALSFAVDEIRLEPTIDRESRDFHPDGAPLARTLARLKAGKPVTVVTMGDSLTDTHHWSNREVAWPDLLKATVKAKYGSELTVVNPAIGGTLLRQNLVLMPRWLDRAPEPDLVTIFFGGNDWDSGMRGEEFLRACTDAIGRVRRATHGRADVLLMTTNPAASRWGATAELAEACRGAAGDRNAGLADTDRAFSNAGKDRDTLFADDRVHLSRAGHGVVAETVLKAIEASGR